MKCAYCNGPCDDRPVRHEAVCWNCLPAPTANPFEALGEAMQTVGLWVLGLWCRIRGHRWIADETAFGDFTKLDGWYCGRCWKYDRYVLPVSTQPSRNQESVDE